MIKAFAVAVLTGASLTLAPLADASPPDPHPNMSCAEANDWADRHNAAVGDKSIPDDVYNAEIGAIRAALKAACGE